MPSFSGVRNQVRVQNGRLFTSGRLFDVSNVAFQEGEKGWPQIAASLTINEFVPQPTTTPEHDRHHVDEHDHHPELGLGGPEHKWRDFMSGKQKRLQNLRQAKDARMKKVAIGGAVLLVAVLAFEVPKMLHSGASTASQPPPATTTTGSSTTSAPRTTPAGTAAAAVTPVASPKLTNSDVQPKVEKSQLYSFSHFAGKDPFVQQVGTIDQPADS